MSLVDLLKLFYCCNKNFRKVICQISRITYEADFNIAKMKKQKQTELSEGTEMLIVIQRVLSFFNQPFSIAQR